MTGRYGNKTGMIRSGPSLGQSEVTIFEYIDSLTEGAYANALFGKWHLGSNSPDRPNAQGIHHFDGNLHSGVDDYYHWEHTVNGVTDTLSEYATSYITNEAINWLDTVSKPWLLWMAYNAPHSPYHIPPDSLYTRTSTMTPADKFFCMIEAVDHETGRLYNSLTPQQMDSTLFIIIGDNGTSNAVLQTYPEGHGKSTLYEGGIRVPMFISGYGVDRVGEQENGMVAVADLYATIIEMLGEELPGGIHNSLSLAGLLTDPNSPTRPYNYSELQDGGVISRAIRSEQYKLIISEDSLGEPTSEFYDLLTDPLEFTELSAAGLTPAQLLVRDDLHAEADSIFYSWSCQDLIQNGSEEDIDCGGFACSSCESTTTIAIPGNEDMGAIKTYPNPIRDWFVIDIEQGEYGLKIFNSFGEIVKEDIVHGYAHVDVGEFSSGMYFLELKNYSAQTVYLKKLFKL